MRKLLLAIALAFGAVAFALAPASAQVSGGIYVRLGPPAPRMERIPPPRPGYVWRPGVWRWNGSRYVWSGGYYVRPPYARAHWVPGHWVHRRHGWFWVRGHWA